LHEDVIDTQVEGVDNASTQHLTHHVKGCMSDHTFQTTSGPSRSLIRLLAQASQLNTRVTRQRV
jgi:hypothetical protein